MADQQLIIRSAERDDFEAWNVLWLAYNEFYGRHGATALAEDVTLTTWSRFFDEHEPMHAMVAHDGESMVGIVHFIFHRSTIQIAPTCYLQDLYTVAAARGKGVGRELIEAVCRHATRCGSTRVYWHTHETNATAMRLYDLVAERSGFVVYRKAC